MPGGFFRFTLQSEKKTFGGKKKKGHSLFSGPIKHVTPIRPSVTATCQKITSSSFEAYLKQFFMDSDFQVNYFDLYRIFFVSEYEFAPRLSGGTGVRNDILELRRALSLFRLTLKILLGS